MTQDLFSDRGKRNYLNVVHNDKVVQCKLQQIFDASRFDTLGVATFVASPKFFFRATKEFTNITLVLGTEDNELGNFFFDMDSQNDFFKELDEETRQKIMDERFKVFVVPPGYTVHSKVYIMENSKSGKRRCAFGSANFTERAFGNKRQYEELLVYDDDYNPGIVDIYTKRFKELLGFSVDFIPDRIRDKIKDTAINVLTLSEEESIDVLKENIKKINTVAVIGSELAETLDLLKIELEDHEGQVRKELEVVRNEKELIKIITATKKGITALVTPMEITRRQDMIVTRVLRKAVVKKEFVDSRTEFLYSARDALLYKTGPNNLSEPLQKVLNADAVKTKIKLLGNFIEAYDSFTVNKKTDVQARIFEVLLYSFMAPYIWKIRDDAAMAENREEIRANMPIFMLVAGQSHSGKTTLIKFISRAMGNLGTYYHYVKQAALTSMEQINPQIINNFLGEENLMPVFVDEIVKEYFSTTSSGTSLYMGEGYIKSMTNARKGPHPCVIATCNTDFAANAQVMRRVYYIQLNNPFDVSKRKETDQYFNPIYEEFGDDLYRDFLSRLEAKIRNVYQAGHDDFLKIGRDIFKSYFNETGTEVPKWLSNTRIDDYYARGKEMWQHLYISRRRGFKINGGELLLDDDIVFGSKMGSGRDKREWLQYLPVGVLIEDKGIVRVNRERFFEFIGQSKNALSRIFKRML